MKTKRTIAILLIAALLMSALPISASAALYDKQEAPYPDIQMSQWYALDCIYVCENDIMTYMQTRDDGARFFCPKEKATREMIATIFWNLYGSPAPTTESSFSDVIAGKWYYDPVSWAEEVGLSFGISETRFGTGQSITREQLATFFYRYAKLQNEELIIDSDITSYSDYQDISKWAVEAMSWAVSNKIISGTGNNCLSPKATATRAEIAAIIHRYFVPEQVTLTKIEVATPPRAAYYITSTPLIRVWGHLSFNLYYSDGTMETVWREDRLPYPLLDLTPVYKNGVPYAKYSLFGVSTYVQLEEVTKLPSPPIDFDAAIAAAHEYAETAFGFQTRVGGSPSDNNASYMSPSCLSMKQLVAYGGQNYLIDQLEGGIDIVHDIYVNFHRESSIPYTVINCCIEYDAELDMYLLYTLYN